MGQISDLQKLIGEVNISNGWTMAEELKEAYAQGTVDDQRLVDHQVAVLALITTEVAEAIEEIRNGESLTENKYLVDGKAVPASEVPNNMIAKPVGFPSELADVVIRSLDFANTWGIDLETAITEKIAYNKTRGYRHGGKKI